jgi:hypothetical protein
MRLTDASVAIRPRSAWEALDLGVLLAQRHARLLMGSWALLTLPLFVLITTCLWRYPSAAMFLFWWLKPAYERLPLYILSRSLFGDTPTLRQSLEAMPGLLKPQLLASLTWRRFNPMRSFTLPVQQLEGLSGEARRQRLAILGQRDASSATWLTIAGMHLEGVLMFGLIALFYLMIPQQLQIDWGWKALIDPEAGEHLWLEHASNLFYALVLIFWEPIYVACGFTLYLNRRTALEAWDIELVFRRLRQRLVGSAYALLLATGLLLVQLPAPAMAADESIGSCPLPAEDPNGPEAPRLLKQHLTSKASHDAVARLLDEPPFENRETVTRWKFDKDDSKPEEKDEASQGMRDLLKGLTHLVDLWKTLDVLALVFEVLLWTALACLIVLLLWRYREWLETFASRLGLPQRRVRETPAQLFGLDVAPESLPDDVAGEVERLWDEQPREALGLLYRALLSRLLHDWRLPLKAAHTEGEVLNLVHKIGKDDLGRFSETLTRHWQNLAYGHRLPPPSLKRGLCEGWRRLFAAGAMP